MAWGKGVCYCTIRKMLYSNNYVLRVNNIFPVTASLLPASHFLLRGVSEEPTVVEVFLFQCYSMEYSISWENSREAGSKLCASPRQRDGNNEPYFGDVLISPPWMNRAILLNKYSVTQTAFHSKKRKLLTKHYFHFFPVWTWYKYEAQCTIAYLETFQEL